MALKDTTLIPGLCSHCKRFSNLIWTTLHEKNKIITFSYCSKCNQYDEMLIGSLIKPNKGPEEDDLFDF